MRFWTRFNNSNWVRGQISAGVVITRNYDTEDFISFFMNLQFYRYLYIYFKNYNLFFFQVIH